VRLACIGSREIPDEAANACREMGMELARAGYTVVTGTTPGTPGQDEWANWADGAFATGAYYVDPTSLLLCLPWRHFPRGSGSLPDGVTVEYVATHPEWLEAAARAWDEMRAASDSLWSAVPRAFRLRHARNVGIILQSQLVLAWPHAEAKGTRSAMSFATWRKVPVIDLALTSWQDVLRALLVQARSGLRH
jgi:hypothetical protein